MDYKGRREITKKRDRESFNIGNNTKNPFQVLLEFQLKKLLLQDKNHHH